MKLKADVDATGVAPELWSFLGAIAVALRLETNAELVVTSLRRPRSSRPSKHSPPQGQLVTAADIRRWALDHAGLAAEFVAGLRKAYGDRLGVVLEPEELTPEEIAARGGRAAIAPHIHVQLKGAPWDHNPL